MPQPLRTFAFFSGSIPYLEKVPLTLKHCCLGNLTTGYQKQFKSWGSSQAESCWAGRQNFSILKGSNTTLAVLRIITARNLSCLPYINPGSSVQLILDLSPRYYSVNSLSLIPQSLVILYLFKNYVLNSFCGLDIVLGAEHIKMNETSFLPRNK